MSGERGSQDSGDGSLGIGGTADVSYHLTVAGVDAELQVMSVGFHERLSRLYDGTVAAHTSSHLERADLLGADIHLSIERGDEQRSVRGIVHSARVARAPGGDDHGFVVSLEVVPAIYLMAHTRDCRIYQGVTVPDLVDELVTELVGNRSRRVDKSGLVEEHPAHEYLVQYRESHIEFLTRLCNEEGIYFYFDHDEEHEVLVLADSNAERPTIRSSSEGRVQYTPSSGATTGGHEVATRVESHEQIGATDAVVSGFDWSNPELQVRSENTGRGAWSGPALEVHEHFHQVRHHGFDGRQYRGHTAEQQARMHAERLDLARQGWTVETTVTTAAPGRTFTLEGTSEHDDEYLIVSVTAHGQNGASGLGNYRNTLHVIPKAMPFRPPLAPRRMMPGPETAVVVGEAGEEITTDEHGRVHVQFHWDRRGERNTRSSAWIRVAQSWAGGGWGSFFVPRHDMEVLVTFLGGDPDRPIITGCLHNGSNGPPLTLPDDKTKSTLKTNSSPGGGGFNELTFEDAAGSEEVYLRAQRNLRELVRHNHLMHVLNNQTIEVDKDQELTVHENRTKTVDLDETNVIKKNRTTRVGDDGGDDSLHALHDRVVQVDGHRTLAVQLTDTQTVHGARDVTLNSGLTQTISSGGELRSTTGNSTHGISGAYSVDAGQSINLKAGTTGMIDVTNALDIKAHLVTIASDTAVNVRAPQGIQHITATQQETIAAKLVEAFTECFSSGAMKFSATGMSVGVTGTTVSYTGAKALFSKFSMGNEDAKIHLGKLNVGNSAVARISRAALTMLG